MMKDGSYDRYFYQPLLMVDALRTLRLDKRRVITLHIMLLPPGAPEEEAEDWMAKLRQYNLRLKIP